jgi:hypothetical protein
MRQAEENIFERFIFIYVQHMISTCLLSNLARENMGCNRGKENFVCEQLFGMLNVSADGGPNVKFEK